MEISKRQVPSWTDYFKSIAKDVSARSKDNSTNIGVVIVGKDNQILSTGYNSFPAGINDNIPERQERPEKYYWFEHAERNSIYNAAKSGVSINGATMYLSCSCPCADCARGIINSGIKEIWIEKNDTTANAAKWDEHAKRSLDMFKEAHIIVNYYN